MKKLGIVGGVAWPSTLDYYKEICRLSVEYHQDKNISGPPPVPEMSIESLNINKSFSLRGSNDNDDTSWKQYDAYFSEALQRLEQSGAEVAIIASNTPHNRFKSITQGIRIPVISIFDAVAQACQAQGVNELLILGTAPTMGMPTFANRLADFGIKGFSPPNAQDRNIIVELIGEPYAFKNQQAAQRIRAVVDHCFPQKDNLRTVCLACTELPMAFPEMERDAFREIDGVRYINTTVVHAQAAFNALIT